MAYGNGNGNASSKQNGNTYGNKKTSEQKEFVKIKDGVKAPLGFHYMPDGKFMSDADHIAIYGYIEKKINGFNIDTSDINYQGETKSFSIIGDSGAVFSLEIFDNDGNYYNFTTKTWTSSVAKLNKVIIGDSSYSVPVKFNSVEFVDSTCDYNNDPTIAHDDDDGKIQAGMSVTGTGIPAGATVDSITSDTAFELSASTTGGAVTNGLLTFSKLKTYTVNLIAETVQNIKTIHVPFIEAKNADNTVNLNASSGSNSHIITKILYQDIKKYLYLSCIAPSLYTASTDTIAGTTSSTNRIVIDSGDGSSDVALNTNIVKIGDKVTTAGVAASVHALVTKINPDNDNTNEIEIGITDSVTNNEVITFTPPFNGITPHSTDSTTGRHTISISSQGSIQTAFSITCTALAGRTFSIKRTPTVDDLCAFTTVTFGSSALALLEEDVSSSTYFRWPVTNISNLALGMTLDPARTGTGVNTTTPSSISNYLTSVTATEVVDGKYSKSIKDVSLQSTFVNGVDAYSNDVTAIDRNGRITALAGNIIFDTKQADALKSDTNVRIFAHGAKQIKDLTGINVALSNMVVTPTQISTTTSGAVSGSATIGLAEVGNVSTISTIRGIGISASVANPTVAGKAVATGAGNITASAAQTLESGQTLYFDGASNIVTITGNITVSNMAISDTTLYFDVEKFLTVV